MDRRVVTVFGGSGFLGRHLVRRLAADGAIVRVAVRDTEAAQFLKTSGDVGQIVPVAVDITAPSLTAAAAAGAHAAVNLVGIPWEGGRRPVGRERADSAGTRARPPGAARHPPSTHTKDSPKGMARTPARTESGSGSERMRSAVACVPAETSAKPSWRT